MALTIRNARCPRAARASLLSRSTVATTIWTPYRPQRPSTADYALPGHSAPEGRSGLAQLGQDRSADVREVTHHLVRVPRLGAASVETDLQEQRAVLQEHTGLDLAFLSLLEN